VQIVRHGRTGGAQVHTFISCTPPVDPCRPMTRWWSRRLFRRRPWRAPR